MTVCVCVYIYIYAYNTYTHTYIHTHTANGKNDEDLGWQLSKHYTFDAVLDENSSTQRVFECTGAKAVPEVVRGVNSIIFAYGQTGSGKTYTLLGEAFRGDKFDQSSKNHGAKQGIASMTFERLHQKLQQRAGSENGTHTDTVRYTVHVSALEIYLDQVYDLFLGSDQALHMRTCVLEKTYTHLGGEVCDLCPRETYHACGSTQDFENVLRQVAAKRMYNSTRMNNSSSRSHLILTLAVKRVMHIGMVMGNQQHSDKAPSIIGDNQGNDRNSAGREYMSKLILVDLAGNERD
jgi:hypothetical protein